MEKKESLGIKETYSVEIQDIHNKLVQLENGRIYELTGAQGDGYLLTNAQQLRKMIAQLINKIDKDLPSINDEIATIFENERD